MIQIEISQVYKSLFRLKRVIINDGDKKILAFAVLLLFSLFIPLTFAAHKTQVGKGNDVLGIASKSISITPSPILEASLTPTPTFTPIATSIPASSPTPTPTSASNTTPSSSPTETPTSIPTSSPTPTPTPTPTPAGQSVQIGIDYGGQKSNDSYSVTVNSDQAAWEVVSSAIGVSNLQYTDYGGDMGIFITGFNGVIASSNQYYEFRVNGVSSSVGVSSYHLSDGDKLDFVLLTF